MHPRKFVRDSLGFALTQSLARGVVMLRGFLAARWLDPLSFGAWGALQIMMDYGALAPVGTQQGLDQMVPPRLVEGDPGRIVRVKRAALGNILLLTALYIAACLTWASVGSSRLRATWHLSGIALALVCVLLINLANYGTSLLRSHGDIPAVSTWFVLQALIGAGLGVALIPAYGRWGLLYGWLAGCFVAFVFVRLRGGPRVPLTPAAGLEGMDLVQIGLPLYLFNLSTLVTRTIDRLVVLRFLGTEALGYYGVSVMALTFLMYLPDSVAYVFYPQLLRRFAEGGDEPAAIRDDVVRVVRVVALLVPALGGVAFLWVHDAVLLVLPKYAPGVPSLRVLCFGATGLAVANLASIVLMTVGRRIVLVPAAVFLAAVGAALEIVAVRLNLGITGVAWATLITYFTSGGVLLGLAGAGLEMRLREVSAFVLRAFAPPALGFALAVALDRTLLASPFASVSARLFDLGSATLLFVVGYVILTLPLSRGAGLRRLLAEFNLPILSPLLRRIGTGTGGRGR